MSDTRPKYPTSGSASPATQFQHVQWAPTVADPGSPSLLKGALTRTKESTDLAPSPGVITPNLPPAFTSFLAANPSSIPQLDTSGLLRFSSTPGPSGTTNPATGLPLPSARVPGLEEDGEGDDDMLPAMADDDYSAQLSWQSQSKDNLKVLMDNLSPEQYDRFEAYRRHALPKQGVRKVIQQSLGQQVSMPVAQIIAGFSKVFVGEIIEKARAVQQRRGETGPLSPDHLREAYRMYQEETGRVGAARPVRSKRLFVR